MKQLSSKAFVLAEQRSLIPLISLFLILLVFAANSYAIDTTTSQESSINSHCPVESFKIFFDAFSENVQLQKKVTQLPLKKLIVINADPEPRSVVNKLKRNQIAYPVIPNLLERQNKGLSVRLETLGPHKAKATLFKDDTDYQVIFFFIKNGCWKLNRIEDWSL
jgi:hypothetical protein